MSTYTYKLDERGRQVLLNALRIVKNAAEEPLLNGEMTDENLQQYEELNLLHRGVLFVRPDPDPDVIERPQEGDAYDPVKASGNGLNYPN